MNAPYLKLDHLKLEQNFMSNHHAEIFVSGGITSASIHAARSLFSEAENKILKTPITILQEMCTKSHINPPIYDLISNEGRVHTPSFLFRCTVGNQISVEGKGVSKKKAKQAAALEALKFMQTVTSQTHPTESKCLDEIM